ncbi:hypothetical protein XELAEV_18037872mg [Xenopus laevis]|uniref:TIR domain-containing protein n=1 Tax=Xenopus laevis TaxID=8355 RepID=A0A974CD15_XENLA|nr:hypothetical protein XELAEV_18037872mg [Xenopus laevis]
MRPYHSTCQIAALMTLILQRLSLTAGYGYRKCSLEGIHMEYANCVGQSIDTLANAIQDLPCQMRVLNVSENGISKIDNYTFSRLPQLKELVLSKNTIGQLDTWAFHNLGNLLILDLSYNLIQSLDTVDLTNLRSLQIFHLKLDLSFNNVSDFRSVANALIDLPDFLRLCLCSNLIADLKSEQSLLVLLSLQSLNLCNNSISALDFTFYSMPSLTELNVTRNNMSAVNKSSFSNLPMLSKVTFDENNLNISQLSGINLTNLTEFHWSSMRPALQNDSASACKVFQTFPKLKLLDIKHSKIGSANLSVIGRCTNLTTLILTTSPFRRLKGKDLQDFKHLEVLYLDKCKLQNIVNSSWMGLEALHTLILERNQLTVLENSLFSPLIGLRYLDLSKNYLTHLNEEAFHGLRRLEYLSLKGCKITEVTKNNFKYFTNLHVLNLQDNSISVIKANAYYYLRTLETLLLSGNKILTIQKNGLKGLVSLKELSLASNNIYKLTNNTLKWLKSIRSLDLSRNQLWPLHKLQSPCPFLNLTHLEILDASYQTTDNIHIPTTLFRGLQSLKVLKFQGNPSVFFKNISFEFLLNLTDLDMSATVYTMTDPPVSFKKELFNMLGQLRILTLDNNGIQFLPEDIFTNVPMLERISLRYNRLTNVTEAIMKNLSKLTYFDMYMNTLSCCCDNYWFQNWSISNTKVQIPYIQSYKCFGLGSDVLFVNQDFSFCNEIGYYYFLGSFMITFSFLIVTLLMVKLKWTIRYLYCMLEVWFQGKLETKKKAHEYDAYISYCDDDEKWVTEKLLYMLEVQGPRKYKLCFKPRDFIPGMYQLDNIQDAISNSRKTLCVVSRKYLQREWCREEMQLACSWAFSYKEDVLLMVLLEEIPEYRLSAYHKLRKLIKQNSYIDWPEDPQGEKVFWLKLQKALDGRVCEENDIQLCD